MSPDDHPETSEHNYEPRPARRATGLGLLLSIVVTIGGLFWALPRLVSSLDHPLAKVAFVLYFIPLLPTLASILQGRPGASWQALPWIYISEALSLLFELLFVILVLPFVFVNMLAVLAAGLAVTLGIILILIALQSIMNWNLGVHIAAQEVPLFAAVWVGLTAAALVFLGLHHWAERNQDSVFDFFRRGYVQLRQRIGLDRVD